MFALNRLWWLGALAIGSALAVLLVLVAFSPAARANHSWGKYHWARKSNPFTLQFGDNVSPSWDSYLGTTSSDWGKSTVLDTTIVGGRTSPATCSPTSGRVEVCNAAYGQNGWLGLAQICISSRQHITAATTKVNDTFFSTPKYNTTAWRNLVMCQEVGHTFGLDHQDENFNNTNLGTCMDYTNDPSTNQHPNQHDYDELVAIYSHLDKTTTIGASSTLPAATSRASLNSRAGWGRLVQESRNEQLALYKRDLGGGKKVFTFVIWA